MRKNKALSIYRIFIITENINSDIVLGKVDSSNACATIRIWLEGNTLNHFTRYTGMGELKVV